MKSPEELKLKVRAASAQKEVDECKRNFFSKRKELDATETKLVEAREAQRKAAEELYNYQNTQIMDVGTDDVRERQIEECKEKLPALLKTIEHEKPIPYRTIMDLDTIDRWPNSKE